MTIAHDCPNSNIPESVLIEIIAWGRTSNKPLPEEMMTKFSDIGVIRHQCVKLAVKIISHHKHILTGRHNKTLNKKDGLTRYGDSHVKDKTS